MTDHVHDWWPQSEIVENHISGDSADVYAECGCGESMDWREMQRRLNATERLNADQARQASESLTEILEWAVPQILGKKPNITHSELEAYAATLSGDENGD